MNSPARTMHTVERMTAGLATALNALILNTLAAADTIRPPADRPTKNMKEVIYSPQDTTFRIPVTIRPLFSW